MEFVLDKTDGQGRKCLETQLMLWNWKLEAHENPNLANAIIRENDRSLWRIYYEERAVYTMRKVQLLQPGPPPIRPDDVVEREIPVMEPPDLEDFHAVIKSEFACASTNFLADLQAFRGDPKGSLTKL